MKSINVIIKRERLFFFFERETCHGIPIDIPECTHSIYYDHHRVPIVDVMVVRLVSQAWLYKAAV